MLHRFYLLIVFLAVAGIAHAQGVYLGGGISFVNLNSDHPSINDQSNTGYHLLIGTRSENWGLEAAASAGMSFNTGPTPGIYYPDDSAEYGILDLGFKRYFHPQKHTNLSPWIGAGIGLHFIDWRSFYYYVDGYGYSLSAGIDCQLNTDWFVRTGAVYHDFESDDTYDYGPYDATAKQLNVMIIYRF